QDLEHGSPVDVMRAAKARRHPRVAGLPAERKRRVVQAPPPPAPGYAVLELAREPAERRGAGEAARSRQQAKRMEKEPPSAAAEPPRRISHGDLRARWFPPPPRPRGSRRRPCGRGDRRPA